MLFIFIYPTYPSKWEINSVVLRKKGKGVKDSHVN